MSALAAAFAESGHGGWRDRRRPSATCAPVACSRSMCPVGGATIGGLERGPWPDHVPVPAFGPRMVCHYNGRLALRPPHGAGQAHCGRHDIGECGYRATAPCRNWSHSWWKDDGCRVTDGTICALGVPDEPFGNFSVSPNVVNSPQHKCG
jgi:hypothetical protein